MKGKHHKPESLLKLSQSLKGKTPWNKGKQGLQTAWNKCKVGLVVSPMKGKKTGRTSWMKGKTFTPEQLERLRKSHLGQVAWNKGKPWSEEFKRKSSETHKLNPSRYWLGKKRPEIAESSRKTLLKLYKSGSFPKQSDTAIEKAVIQELIKRGYRLETDFTTQYNFYGVFSCDICFPKQKLIVECDGDYWHVNPKKYAGKSLDKIQIKTINKDKAKNAYIAKADNSAWRMLRFWETDIRKDVSKCVDEIENYLQV